MDEHGLTSADILELWTPGLEPSKVWWAGEWLATGETDGRLEYDFSLTFDDRENGDPDFVELNHWETENKFDAFTANGVEKESGLGTVFEGGFFTDRSKAWSPLNSTGLGWLWVAAEWFGLGCEFLCWVPSTSNERFFNADIADKSAGLTMITTG